jgi:glycosyltransferase involved in cell wall biosynthesis
MARTLSERFEVELAVPESKAGREDAAFFAGAPVKIFIYSVDRPKELLARAAAARIVVVQGYVLSKFPGLEDLSLPLVADIYDPFVLENLFIHQKKIGSLRDREAVHYHDLGVFNGLLRRGDHFLVASDRQKDLVTGFLLALGRIGPSDLDAGAGLEELLSVVPFGIEAETGPIGGEKTSSEFRALFPDIADDDILLLWGGVLSSWYDPETLLRAMKTARESDPRIKLLFLATGHPNPVVPAMDAVPAARKLAAELGLSAGAVTFNDGWIPYARRGSVFRRADIGVSIHKTHFETRYAFRTRMLDYLKYGLPIIGTEGDVFAELVEKKALGRVVGSGDTAGLARAIVELAGNAEERAAIRARAAEFRDRFLWKNTVEPLSAWCGRVLAGGFAVPRRPSREDVIRVCAGSTGPASSGLLKRWAGRLGRRLPPGLRDRLRRFWKG